MAFLSKLFGGGNDRYVASLQPLVEEINAREVEMQKLSDDALRTLTAKFRERLTVGESLDDILPEAFAAVREASRRFLNKRHFDVQLMGGIVLHRGKIAEMKTGEGKTLVATLPLYLNALAGKGAHLVTPNDYLSRVGAGWMGPVYHGLGVSVGVIAHEWSGMYDPSYLDPQPHGDERLRHFCPVSRREAYAADLTYGTNNEFGFDYLRDNLEYLPSQLRQREHAYAIVDEIDSILIDEARTPLIISRPDEESADLYQSFSRITPQLKENEDYNIDEKLRAVAMTEQGIDRVERILGLENIYEEKGVRFVHHLEQALRAEALFHRDREYVVKDGEVIIVDEFTGRLMPGRRWSDGLHQAVEAKENVAVQKESRTLATITFQNYFRMYGKLAGMTGTAETSAEEFHKVYELDVVAIPTNKPMVRADLADLIFRTEAGKFRAVVREVKKRHADGQPVLIGTVSIAQNERLSKMLEIEGVRHTVLNAKNHEQEALIIAEAGKSGAGTVATNMAGRGVDIILGGGEVDSPEADKVRRAGGLHVIGTERHEARRIDNQLRGRAGRQGDPGSSQFFVSLEDNLMRVFGSDKIKRLMETLGIPEDEPIEARMVSRALESAQAKIEGFHFDARKHVLDYDDVLNKQRDAIYRMRRAILFSEVPAEENEELMRAGAPADEKNKTVTLRERILAMVEDEVARIVAFHAAVSDGSAWDVEEMVESVGAIAALPHEAHARLLEIRAREDDDDEKKRIGMITYLCGVLRAQYAEREAAIGADGMRNIERGTLLGAIDALWMDHLDQMEHLRDSVRLRAYGQRDPLVEYKHEGSRLYRELNAAIRAQVVNTIFKIGGAIRPEASTSHVIEMRGPDMAPVINQNQSSLHESVGQRPVAHAVRHAHATPVVAGKKEPDRNASCPCGSGKKFKKCHMT